MKIAFDEHLPPSIAAALKAFEGDDSLLRCDIVSARDYALPKAKSDVPWLEKFASDGGHVVVSGDVKMRGKLHEQRALSKAGFIVIFLSRRWGQANGYDKLSMLIRWWPRILERIRHARPGQFFEVPYGWQGSELIEVTPPEVPRKKPGRKPRGAVKATAA